MAAKRISRKKGKVAGKSGQNLTKLKVPPRWFQSKHCTPQEVCKYLEDLNLWLDWFWKDYRNLRVAMCNVERKAWSESGSLQSRRF